MYSQYLKAALYNDNRLKATCLIRQTECNKLVFERFGYWAAQDEIDHPTPREIILIAELGLIEITDAKGVVYEKPNATLYSEVTISDAKYWMVEFETVNRVPIPETEETNTIVKIFPSGTTPSTKILAWTTKFWR